MWRNSYLKARIVFLTCVVSLAGGSAFGDVIPIRLSQSVSGTEAPIACAGGILGPCSQGFSSFSVSNSTIGPYSVSKSDQATATITDFNAFPIPITLSVTSSVHTDQSSDETANSISVSMNTTTEMVGGSTGGLEPVIGGITDGTNNYSLQFDLATPSLVHLTGSAFAIEFGELIPTFVQNVAFSLTGPGFDLDSASEFPCEGGFCGRTFTTFDDAFLLLPGVYTFTASEDAFVSTPLAIDVQNLERLSLQLDFTQVPEPRWNSVVLFLLLTTASLVVRRVTTACSRSPSSAGADSRTRRSARPTRLTVRVKQPETEHTISVGKLQSWLDGRGKSPNEQVLKRRLREMRD